MVAHHEVTVFRHLVRELDVAFAERKLINIRFIKNLVIYRYYAVFINGDHISGTADDPLEQKFVLPVKAAQIPGLHILRFDQKEDIFVLQGRVHTIT